MKVGGLLFFWRERRGREGWISRGQGVLVEDLKDMVLQDIVGSTHEERHEDI